MDKPKTPPSLSSTLETRIAADPGPGLAVVKPISYAYGRGPSERSQREGLSSPSGLGGREA